MNKILNISIVVLGLSLVVSATLALTAGTRPKQRAQATTNGAGAAWHALWYNTPKSAQEAYTLGQVAVRATVTKIAQAPELVVPAQGEPSGVDRVPNQAVTFSVDEVYKGQITPHFDLFHTGTADKWVDGDPPYAVGQQYVLFLLPRPDGRWVLVAPEARYAVTQGSVHPVSDNPAVANTNGVSLASFMRALTSTAP